MKLETKTNFSFLKLANKLPGIVKKATSSIAKSSAVRAKKNIEKGLKPPLKRSTIELRQERGTGGTKPLYETGALHRSIKGSESGLQMLEYGWYHQKGYKSKNVPIGFDGKGKNAKPIFHKNKKIQKDVPARPFITLTDKELAEDANQIKAAIHKALYKTKNVR